MKLVLGKWAVDRVAAGASPDEAAHEAIDYLFNGWADTAASFCSGRMAA